MQKPAFTNMTDLAAERLGGQVLFANDEFFAGKENLIKPGRGEFIAGKYTDRGKWMDGWETRRRRSPGHDWCLVRLAVPGRIRGLDIDTNHFLGNHPPFASVDALHLSGGDTLSVDHMKDLPWIELLPESPLQPGNHNFFDIRSDKTWTHLRLNIYPDGGVARLKVYGEAVREFIPGEIVDLAAAANGGRSLACNDMFFSHMEHLIMPGRGINMGDGWETKRNRNPDNRDWVIIKLATTGKIQKVVVDTCHFKGNYPDKCMLEGCLVAKEDGFDADQARWKEILPPTKLSADCEHIFLKEIKNKGPFSHVRLSIMPDGGVSRLRVFGMPET